MNQQLNNTTGASGATKTPKIGDAIDAVCKAINLADLLDLAATGIFSNGHKSDGEALLVGVYALHAELKSAKAILYGVAEGVAS